MARLSEAQRKLLARIKRCEKGCFVQVAERRTAAILARLGLIDLNGQGNIAYPKEAA